ncbi:hypothetical protein HanIR_Chr07g0319371 [Helianthus annuus]|nr:hypothetical protein HanIR_Chr07g0319371 [Helianthus annuus]
MESQQFDLKIFTWHASFSFFFFFFHLSYCVCDCLKLVTLVVRYSNQKKYAKEDINSYFTNESEFLGTVVTC